MVFRRFRHSLLWRLALLVATLTALIYTLLASHLYALAILLLVLTALEVYSLFRLVDTTNRDLTRFLESIEYSDYSQTFTSGLKGKTYTELNAAFSEVMSRFRDIRREGHENFRYLQSVVQHVGIGLVVFRDNGEVELMNAAAKRLFDVASLKDIAALARISKTLVDRIRALQPGNRDLVTVTRQDELMQLSLYLTELRMRDRKLTLVSFQNITNELNEKEMEAWQHLIRVLTHEIRNSLTPIASMAATVEDLLRADKSDSVVLEADLAEDVQEALRTIQNRSQGLLRFVEAYRNLTHIKKPDFEKVDIAELVSRVLSLVRTQAGDLGIQLVQAIEPTSLSLTADPQLIEQVLINLLLNAVQSLDGQPDGRVTVEACIDDKGRTVIRVGDNGPGIDESALQSIFVPFFTTKSGGSGIGLSLSRQIMRLHRGDLTVVSEPHRTTVFTMRF